MIRKPIVVLLVCMLVSSTLLVGACAKAPVTEAPEKSLTVGVSATYTGGMAAIGKHVSDGMIDYLHWIASQGGIEYKDPVSGQTERVAIKVIWEDNQYDVAKATSAYKRLRAGGANVIIAFGSTPGEACAASCSRDKLPYLSWYSYASPAGYAPKPQYYWSLLPTIGESSTGMAKWFVKEKWQGVETPKVGYMAADIPSWRVLRKPGLMEPYIESIGGELVGIEFMPVTATDLSVPITRLIIDKKADCIIFIGTLGQTVVAAKDIIRLGIDLDETTIICNLSAWDESLFKSISREVEGLYGEIFSTLPTEDVPGMKVVREVSEWAGRSPEEVNVNYITGFVGSLVLEAAVKRALEKKGYESVASSGEDIRWELANFAPLDTGGLMPEVKITHPEVEPYFLVYTRITQAKGGRLNVVSDWITIDLIEGAIEID